MALSVVVPQSKSEFGFDSGFESWGNQNVRELRGRVKFGIQGHTSGSHIATVALCNLFLIVATCDSLTAVLDNSETDRHGGAIVSCLESGSQQNKDFYGTACLDLYSKLRVIWETVMIDATTGSIILNAPSRVVVQFSEEVLIEVLAKRKTWEVAEPIYIGHPECSIFRPDNNMFNASLSHSFIDNLLSSLSPVTALVTPSTQPLGRIAPGVPDLKDFIPLNFYCIEDGIGMTLDDSKIWCFCVRASRGRTSHKIPIVNPEGKSLPKFTIIKNSS